MYPAPSVIIFSVCSGMGFGLLAMLGMGLGMGLAQAAGWLAFFWWGLGYALAVVGLSAAAFHLGNPKNALKAFSQWRTSWLSREAWAAVLSLVLLAPMALSDWLGLGLWRGIGVIGALGALFTVFTTSMIYAQIKAVPRWHHWTTPLVFIAFALTGGAILAGQGGAIGLALLLGGLLVWVWQIGDGQFARAAQSMGTATGLAGGISVFERGHTAGNYLLKEMVYVVGRKHVQKLRAIAVLLVAVTPAVAMLLAPNVWGYGFAALSHVIGAFVTRWLFFAQAEHVVGLFYGQR